MNSWLRHLVPGYKLNLIAAASAAVLISGAWPPTLLAQALDPSRKLSQYRLRVWTDEQGLPQNSANAVTQLRDGTVLIGTQDGLALFDGSRLGSPLWGPLSTAGPVWANSLLQDTSGTIWIATRARGLLRVSADTVVSYRLSAGSGETSLEALFRDASGRLWVGSSAAGLFHFDGERAARVPFDRAPGSEWVQAITQDGSGRLVVATRGGLYVGAPGRWRRFGPEQGLSSEHVYSLEPAGGDSVWIGTSDGGLAVLVAGVIRPVAGWAKTESPISAIKRDRAGFLWVGTNGGGLYRFSRGKAEALTVKDGFPSNLVWTLAADDEGGLWIGTNGGGVARLDDPPVTVFGAKEGLSSDVALATLQARDGTMWIGTAGGGLNALKDGVVRTFTTAHGLTSNIVTALHEDAGGVLWIGTVPRGLHTRKDGRITVVRDSPFPGVGILSIREDARGRLWVGSEGAGLARYEHGRWIVIKDSLSPPSNFVHALATDARGTVYAGTRAGVVAVEGDRVVRQPVFADQLKNNILSLHLDSAGSLWVASYASGVGRLRAGRLVQIGAEQGLPDQGVNGILEDRSGRMWLTTNKGIFGVSKTQLDDVADGKRSRVSGYLIGTAEGMRSRETNGGVDPPGWVARDGKVWIPTMSGVVTIDPARISDVPPPRASVTGITIRETHFPIEPELRIPGNARRLSIAFQAMSFAPPEGIIVQYRLAGVDDDWVDAGAARTAEYTSLPAGANLFEVRARQRLGSWGPVASARFRRAPLWFERRTVQLAALLLLGAILFSAHRSRRYWQQEAGRHESSAAEKEMVLAAVREREARFSALLEHASDAIFLLDASGRVSYVTRSKERITGRSSEDLLGKPFVDLIHPDDRVEVAAALELVTSRPGRPVPFRYRIELPKAGWRTFSAIGRNLLDQEIVGGIIVNARDVTEQEEAESLFLQAQKAEAIGSLAGGIAHDFNNILAVIGANASLLKDDLADLEVEVEGLDEITNATAGGQRLTQQLLGFARRQVTNPAVVDLNAIVQETGPMLRPLMGSSVRLVVETEAEPAPVYIDRGEVEQVIVNLVVNAKSAMPRGGTVTVRVSREAAVNGNVAAGQKGDYVVLSVRDTGTGMDTATRSRIFDPFFTTKATGTGLGLATVSWIAKKAHGFVDVETEVDKGSLFMVHLPLVAAAPVAARSGGNGRLANTVVLVVDDDEPVRVLAARVLRDAGADVLIAESADAALAICRSRQGGVDVLLTDLVMPDMSGRELAERFVELCPASVLYMSGYSDAEISRTRAEGKDVGFVVKPFRAEELLAAVVAACRGDAAPAGAA